MQVLVAIWCRFDPSRFTIQMLFASRANTKRVPSGDQLGDTSSLPVGVSCVRVPLAEMVNKLPPGLSVLEKAISAWDGDHAGVYALGDTGCGSDPSALTVQVPPLAT